MEHFKKLSISERIISENKLIDIEDRYDFKFPVIFHEFILNYEVGQYLEKWDTYLDRYLRPTPIYRIRIPTSNEYLSYNWLSSLNQIEHDLMYYPKVLDLLRNDCLLRIGDIVEFGGLFLGIGKNNIDLIYKYSYDKDESPKCIYDSIYNFVDAIILEIVDGNNSFNYDQGKRYFKKEGVQFINSSFLSSLNIREKYKVEFISSDDFLNGLKEAIKDVQS
jgi:hypothetical protein